VQIERDENEGSEVRGCGVFVYKCFLPAAMEGLEGEVWSCDLWL